MNHCHRIINKLIAVSIVVSLAACAVPPSRSYTKNPRNIEVLAPDSLNIDSITPVKQSIAANKAWQNTGVFLGNGDVVSINANGSWSPAPALMAWSGPEGNALWSVEVPGINGGALMAKLGHDGHPFEIGSTRTFKAQDYGMLYLAINDPFRYLFDNTGTAETEIFVKGNENTQAQNKLNITGYSYDANTGKGILSARVSGDHFATRERMMKKIGEIASSKNIAIKAGKEPLKGGNYELTNESTANDVLTLEFQSLW